MTNKNVDLFQASKDMGIRVSDFMSKKVWGIALSTRYKKEVAEIEAAINGLKKCAGSVLADSAETDIVALEARIPVLHEAMQKQKEEEATFTFTEADNTLYKSYKSATTIAQVHSAFEVWFRVYDLEVANTTFINDIVAAISGFQPANNKTVVRSEATVFTDKRTKTNFLKVFYGKLAEEMLKAGTLKATAIPEDVREFYAPKKKEGKRSKKANKGVK